MSYLLLKSQKKENYFRALLLSGMCLRAITTEEMISVVSPVQNHYHPPKQSLWSSYTHYKIPILNPSSPFKEVIRNSNNRVQENRVQLWQHPVQENTSLWFLASERLKTIHWCLNHLNHNLHAGFEYNARKEILTHRLPILINPSCCNKNRIWLKGIWPMESQTACLFLRVAFTKL